MKIYLVDRAGCPGMVHSVCGELVELGFDAELLEDDDHCNRGHVVTLGKGRPSGIGHWVDLDEPLCSPIEQVLRTIPIEFDSLPLVTEGESKVLRRWTDHLVVERFKPTVYSFSQNRYGQAQGTDEIRARFSAEIFRRMHKMSQGVDFPNNAFVALLETADGPLTVQRLVETCNLEVRVKRFHVGSPLHRYLYTERFNTVQLGSPLKQWSRFDKPVVCFDWRHPLTDEQGRRLADEPVSDDYAAVWMEDVAHAKWMARQSFEWLERLFAESGLLLIDICLFIDKSGHMLFGEISPDCMRVRNSGGNLEESDAYDKDLWRHGRSPKTLHQQYEVLFNRLFLNNQEEEELCRNV